REMLAPALKTPKPSPKAVTAPADDDKDYPPSESSETESLASDEAESVSNAMDMDQDSSFTTGNVDQHESTTNMAALIQTELETHWSQTTHQAWSYPIRPYSLRQTAATASPNWHGVAIFTSEEMSQHIQSTTTAIYEDGREMGTALKVVLGFHRWRVHLIGAYVPTASPTNMADHTRTQQIVHGWLTVVLDAGNEFILAGDLNEHLFEENWSNPTQLGRFL
ncbi:hypothetical protein LPJ69_003981, partial [Coemansia sp. RSA 1752]